MKKERVNMDNKEELFELSAEELEKITGGKNQKVRAIKAGVNIHKEPGEGKEIVSQTTAGAMANYTGDLVYVKGEPWIKVKWNGKSGWIKAKYVKIV